HSAFDQMKFTFVPKSSTAGTQTVVTHLLAPSVELCRLYHNTELHSIAVSCELLFARFAWSIFPFLEGFLQDDVPRELLLVTLPEDVRSQSASSEVCKSFTKQSGKRSKSMSPRKRQRPEATSDIEAAGAMTPGRSRKRMRLSIN